jgi:hypothetical protein
MQKKRRCVIRKDDFTVDLTCHALSAHLLSEFAKKIVSPYYGGNLNSAIQDLMEKAIAEQEFVHSRISYSRKVIPQNNPLRSPKNLNKKST